MFADDSLALDDARRSLVSHNQGLAPFLASGYRSQARAAGIPYDDLVQEALLGLCVGASRFDPDLVDVQPGPDSDDVQVNRQFRTYCSHWIQAALVRVIALAVTFPTILLDPDAVVDVPHDDSLSDRAMQRLWDAIDELPHRDRAILLRRFGLGGVRKMTLEKINVRLSISPKMVRKSLLRSFESIASRIRKAQ